MRRVVAVTDTERPSAVSAVAGAVGGILGVTVSRFTAAAQVDRHSASVLDEIERPDTVLVVLARDRPQTGQAWRIAVEASKPVIVVPPTLRIADARSISRMLVPLDGTLESAAAVDQAMSLFATAGVKLVVLHVFDETTVPAFWDQAAHAHQTWEQEFRARFCATVDARVELRSGEPGQHVVQVADETHADLVVIGWSQRLEPGHARTARTIVRETEVPVMLVPLSLPDRPFDSE